VPADEQVVPREAAAQSEARSMSLFPLARFEVIELSEANRALIAWAHFLGQFDRPFGYQAFGLFLGDALVSVAISGSTINATCAGWERGRVVELARLCSHPDHRWSTRVCLRFWRVTAPASWGSEYWPVDAAVSYQNAARHSGDIYRFDGWKKVAEVRGSGAGGTWSRKKGERKAIWVYEFASVAA
jgi:hypothetical protein